MAKYGSSLGCLAVLTLLPSGLTAQVSRRTQVQLTPYLAAAHWKGEGDLVGGGFQFEGAATQYLNLYTDLGVAAIARGCDALVGAACPSKAWYVLAGIRVFPAPSWGKVKPYLALATGRMDLGNSGSVLRGEGGFLVAMRAPLALQLGLHYTRSYRDPGPQLWGLLAGLRIPL